MGSSLFPYLEMKVHSALLQGEWRKVRVVGEYDRKCLVSEHEKTGKLFNWQRPTAEIVGSELIVKCFPGRDYVYHYALIIATYLSMKGSFRHQVYYEIPDTSSCAQAISGISLDGSTDQVVILGWGLEHLAGEGEWKRENGYAWKRTIEGGESVLHVGFFHSIWGDVAGRVVSRLAKLGARRILYVGKVGTLDPSLRPNSLLATGSESLLGSNPVSWTDFFDGEATVDPQVVTGKHITSASTLLESKDWLRRHRAEYSFVDPEIGPMGSAASNAGIPFGFLHIISNNLTRRYHEDLSNERLSPVVHQRARLLEKARKVILSRLANIRRGQPI